MIEENLGKCVSLSKGVGGSVLQVFLNSNIALLLILCTLLSLATPFLLEWKRRRVRGGESAGEADNA
jgi:putative tricarboxylic transport membrane protein